MAKSRSMLPFVSVVTPTRNRAAFIPQLLRCYQRQDYPLDRMELVILDTSDEPVESLLAGVSGLRYTHESGARPIGFMRNWLAHEARGEIIVHFDDDDYYPKSRVSHAVQRLSASQAGIAGASEMFILDARSGAIVRSGPYGSRHSAAGAMAYTRAYLADHAFDPTVRRGEEVAFTRNFSEPMVQLDARATILCVNHGSNTFDKTRIKSTPTTLTVQDFVDCKRSLKFYRYQLPRRLAAPAAARAIGDGSGG